jgi:hypothetical protein
MANQRTFYACQGVALTPLKPVPNSVDTFTPGTKSFVHGVQSIGFNSTFNIENIFELGQLEIYDAKLNSADIEITIEKVLDGYRTCWGIITDNADDKTLAVCSKQRVNLDFAVYADTGNAGNGAAEITVQCTGMYVNNVTYTFPVDGNLTESITLVGNHKQWGDGSLTVPSAVSGGTDNPAAAGDTILKREDVVVTSPGSAKAQNVTLSLNMNREDVFEFGKRIPYAKLATYPIEVTAEIESLLIPSENEDDANFDADTNALPIKNATISVAVPSLNISLGSKAFLTGISQAGGDATGGNATITRSFTAYNTFTVNDTGTL